MSCLSSSCKCTAVLASVFIVNLSVSFAIGTMTEINQLRIALQESATARNITEGQCISLKVDCLCCLNYEDESWGQLFFRRLLLMLWLYMYRECLGFKVFWKVWELKIYSWSLEEQPNHSKTRKWAVISCFIICSVVAIRNKGWYIVEWPYSLYMYTVSGCGDGMHGVFVAIRILL